MPKPIVLLTLGILLACGAGLIARRLPPETSPKERIDEAFPSQALPAEMSLAEEPVNIETEQKPTQAIDTPFNEVDQWWQQPTYSSFQYDPVLADDPDYRKLVTHHLYLDAFYKSPVRLEDSFQHLLSIIEDWGIDPEQEIELLVQANNMAFQYHAALGHYRNSTGILSNESDRQRAKKHRDFTINNMRETFRFLFDGYEEAKFDELMRIKPTANFLPYSMKIAPGTRLISK